MTPGGIWSFRYVAVDPFDLDNELHEVAGISGGTLVADDGGDIKRNAHLDFDTMPDVGNSLIRVYVDVEASGVVHTTELGTYFVEMADWYHALGTDSGTLDCYGTLSRYDCAARIADSYAAGSGALTLAKAIIRANGGTYRQAQGCADKPLNDARYHDAGKRVLDILNEMLEYTGCGRADSDTHGNVRIEPHVDPLSKATAYTFDDSEDGVYMVGVDVADDASTVPNMILASCHNSSQTLETYVTLDGNSPYGFRSRGRYVTDEIRLDDVADLPSLERAARAELVKRLATLKRYTIRHTYAPIVIGDVVRLVYRDRAGEPWCSALCLVSEMDIDLEPGLPSTTVLSVLREDEVETATPKNRVLYIAETGDDSAAGTLERPMKTVKAAYDRISDGGTIFVLSNKDEAAMVLGRDITVSIASADPTTGKPLASSKAWNIRWNGTATNLSTRLMTITAGTVSLSSIRLRYNDSSTPVRECSGISVTNATLNLYGGATIGDFHSSGNGGAVYAVDSTINCHGGALSGWSDAYGGDLYAQECEVAVSAGWSTTTSSTHEKALRGGCVYAVDSTVRISGGTLSAELIPTAPTPYGGIIGLASSTLELSGGVLKGGAGTLGGGVWVSSSTMTMTGGMVSNCQSITQGAIYVDETSTFSGLGGTIAYNRIGGGVVIKPGATRTISTALKVRDNYPFDLVEE